VEAHDAITVSALPLLFAPRISDLGPPYFEGELHPQHASMYVCTFTPCHAQRQGRKVDRRHGSLDPGATSGELSQYLSPTAWNNQHTQMLPEYATP